MGSIEVALLGTLLSRGAMAVLRSYLRTRTAARSTDPTWNVGAEAAFAYEPAQAAVRSLVERARNEQRAGEAAEARRLLDKALLHVDGLIAVDLRAPADALSGVIWSLHGQVARRGGLGDRAREDCAKAVVHFGRVPVESLTRRDRSDLGCALAVIGRFDEAARALDVGRAEAQPPEATLWMARLALRTGNYTDGERYANESLLALPDDPEVHEILGRAQLELGRAEARVTLHRAAELFIGEERAQDALTVLDVLQPLEPPTPAVLNLRSQALVLAGRRFEALAALDEALPAAPRDAVLLGQRALLHATLGNLTEALSDVDRAVAIDPSDASLRLIQAHVRQRLGDIDGARHAVGQALGLDSTQASAYRLLAQVEQEAGNPVAALTAVQSGRVYAPHDADLLRLHAALAGTVGDLTQAVELWRWLVTGDEVTPEDHAAYVRAQLDAGRAEDAAITAQVAVRDWPDNGELRALYGMALRAAGRPVEGLRVLTAAAGNAPTSTEVLLNLADAIGADATADHGTRARILALLDRAEHTAPDRAAPLTARARLLLSWGELVEARREVARALQVDPDDRDARLIRAELSLLSRPADADREVRELLASDPDDVAATLVLARAYARQGQPRQAYEVLRTMPVAVVRGRSVRRSQWLLLRAELLIDLGRWAEAETDLDALSDPMDAGARIRDRYLRAEMARLRGDGTEALRLAREVLRAAPDHRDAQATAGCAYLLLGNTQRAGEAFDALIESHPDFLFAYTMRARVAAVDGDPGEAKRLLDMVAAAGPVDRATALQRAWVDVTLGDFAAAETAFRLLHGEAPGADALAGLAEALRGQGRAVDAATAASAALDAKPDNPDALRTMGFALLELRDGEAAVAHLRRAAELNPDDAGALVDLGCAYRTVGDVDAALEVLDRACVVGPSNRFALSQLSGLLNDCGAYDDAVTLARRAVVADARDGGAWLALGWAARFRQPPDPGLMAEAYGTALAVAPDNPHAREGLATATQLRGDAESATRLYRNLLDDLTALGDPAGEGLRGWCAYRLGDLTTAARALFQACSRLDRPSSLRFDLALVHLCDGRTARAEQAYGRLVAAPDVSPHLMRGMLTVARADLARAVVDWPGLAGLPEVNRIGELLTEAATKLPPLPVIRAVR